MKTIIKFYLVNYNRKYKSYDDCYNHHLAERSRYHYEVGQYEFGSAHTHEDMIEFRSKQEADMEWEGINEVCGGEIRPIQIESEKQILEIEKSDGFVRWIDPKDIPVRPPRESIKKIVGIE